MTRRRIRARDSRNSEIAELARDVDDVLDTFLPIRAVKMDTVYTEPLTLASTKEPVHVLCRAQLSSSDDTAVDAGNVHWKWDGVAVQVIDIPNLSVGTQYRMTFMVFG
jgi:hypothetical protein